MTADTVGGVWTYALELVRALQTSEVEVSLATMGASVSEAQRADAERLSNLTVFESTFKLEWMTDPWEDVAAAGEWLLDLEAELRPDLIHLNGYVHAALPWSAPTVVVGHSCVYSWFNGVYGIDPTEEEWGRYRREVARGLRAAGRVTAPSEAMLSALRKHYGGFTSAPAIYNGRHAGAFPPASKEPFILTAGRLWDEAKNIRALDSVAEALHWPVRMAGEASNPDGGDADFALEPLGRLTQEVLATIYGRASIFALPARYEPFGLCPLEAALAGCALVLGDLPTLREVWGDTVLYIDPNDESALANGINRLIDDAHLRHDLAARSRARAEKYSVEAMTKGYLRLYESALGGSSAPPISDRASRRMRIQDTHKAAS